MPCPAIKLKPERFCSRSRNPRRPSSFLFSSRRRHTMSDRDWSSDVCSSDLSGGGHVWAELVDPDSREPMTIEPGAVGELVYTHLTREAHPVVRFLGGDLVEVHGGDCGCGRATFRMRIIGRRDDMFIVRGVNVYPSAILAVVGRFRPRVTGRARVIRKAPDVSVPPPVPVEVEVPDGDHADERLAEEIEAAIHSTLTFRAKVDLIPERAFGESGYKTRLTVKRP